MKLIKKSALSVALFALAKLALTPNAQASDEQSSNCLARELVVCSTKQSTIESDVASNDQTSEDGNLENIQALLKQLNKENAVETDELGNIRLKPSILDQLKTQGRLSHRSAQDGSICN